MKQKMGKSFVEAVQGVYSSVIIRVAVCLHKNSGRIRLRDSVVFSFLTDDGEDVRRRVFLRI